MSWRAPGASQRHDERLMWTYGGLFLVVVVALLTLAWIRISSLGEANEARLAKSLGQTLSESVHRISFSGKYHASLLLDGYIEANPDLAYIVVEKFDGTMYAEAHREGLDAEQFASARMPVAGGGNARETVSQALEVGGLPVLEISTPFVEGYLNEHIGTLRVGIDRSAAKDNTLGGLASLLFFGVLIAVLGGVMLHRVSRKLADPVHDLAATFEGILRHSPLLIAVQDRAGYIVRGSQSLIDTYGLDPESRAVLATELRAPDRTAVRAAEDEAIFRGECSIINETRTLNMDGAQRRFAVTRFPLRARGSDRVDHICSLALDITEKLELEAHLERSRRMDTIGQFAGGVAHDFNNLLMAMMGCAELLALSADDPLSVQSLSAEIVRSGNAAAELTEKLLSFGRRQILTTADHDICRILAESRVFLERILPADVVLELECPSEPLWVHADRGQLEQVFMNLIANARDAMPKGGRISITAKSIEASRAGGSGVTETGSGRHVELSIRDTGTGIAPEIFDRILDPFTTTKDLGKGTGLGLSIVYSIVEQHGGVLDFESAPGRGTQFSILLPQLSSGREAEASGPRLQPAQGLHVLVVEDNETVRHFAMRALAQLGHTSEGAADGVEGGAYLSREGASFDLVLADVIMPRLGGDELYRQQTDAGREIPFLFMTGHDRAAVGRLREEQRPSGGTIHCIQKPFDIEALGQAIGDVLNTRVSSP